MDSENRKCQNCKREFTVEPEDFAFYKKLSVPPPTFCPDCRFQRQLAFFNLINLYKRKCDLCGKGSFSAYPPDAPYTVYCPPCWWSDVWDPFEYGRDYDFSRPFFEQYNELLHEVPHIALLVESNVFQTSPYTNYAGSLKNCYLLFNAEYNENSSVGHYVFNSNWLFDSSLAMQCENSYDSMHFYKVNGGVGLRTQVSESLDCYYSFDCRNCKNCFLCSGLRNKEYCILNKQYSKEDYQKKVEEYKLFSHESRKKLYKEWLELMMKSLHRFSVIENSVNVSGNMILNSKNSYHIFDGNDIEDSKYSHLSLDMKNSYDFYHVGIQCELVYEGHGMVRDYNVHFCHLCYDNSNLEYCDTCHNSENLFGCASIKKGSYAIFNKRYGKEEYEELRGKIIEHMKSTGEYGEYFSPKISPIGYNETQGTIYMPLAKEEVLERGWKWEEETPGTFGKETLKPEDMPDDIGDIDESITKEVFKCVGCSRNYNIIQYEIQLYKRLGIPAPRLCPDCRYRRKIAIRTPRKLWHRQCMCDYEVHKNTSKHNHHQTGRCPNEFETPYSPDRKEIVYCEECYNAEVA